jgi:hypothetical protein
MEDGTGPIREHLFKSITILLPSTIAPAGSASAELESDSLQP